MLQNIERKILYSKFITEIIKTNKVLAIYLGGSKIYDLDSPESNYDIIIITKDYSLLNYNYTSLIIDNYQIDISIQPIEELIEVLKEPLEYSELQTLKNFLDIIYNNTTLYQSKSLNKFLFNLNKYRETILNLVLFKLKKSLELIIKPPVYLYTKELYYYLLVLYLLINLTTTSKISLTAEQKNTLKTFKTTTQIPDVFYKLYQDYIGYNIYILDTNYTKLYEEMKLYE